MSINVKKYTKDQMAKMVEDAQEAVKKVTERMNELQSRVGGLEAQARILKAKNAIMTEQIDQMTGEAINKANEIANLKADADALRNKLADTEAALGRANAKLTYSVTEKNELQIKLTAAEGALGKMNDKIVQCEAYSRTLRGDVNKMQLEKIGAIMRADYAEAHPWRNLWRHGWALVKRKLKMA